MDQDNEVSGDATPPPGYLQELAELAADCASVLGLLESAGLHGNTQFEADL